MMATCQTKKQIYFVGCAVMDTLDKDMRLDVFQFQQTLAVVSAFLQA